jgi:3-deoxy-7-phosphoheptulonate synthase
MAAIALIPRQPLHSLLEDKAMLVVMKAQATPEQVQVVCDHIEQLGFRAHALPGAQRTAVGITGNQGEVDRGNLECLPGVAEVIRVSKPYKLASRDVKEEDTVIRFPGTNAASRHLP